MNKGLQSPSPSSPLIPYYVLARSDGRACKVLFLVPTALVPRLTRYPILCRGSVFRLNLDESGDENSDDNGRGAGDDQSDDEDGSFLAVDFRSPYPDDLAREIAIRLTKRLEDAKENQEAGRQNFLLLTSC